MSPLIIEICLHYHTMPQVDAPFLKSHAPAVPEVSRELVSKGLLRTTSGPDTKRSFEPTEKLHAYVTMLIATPLPAQSWADPRTKEIVSVISP